MKARTNHDASVPAGGAPERSAFDWVRDTRIGSELAREVRAKVRRRRRRTVVAGLAAACAAVSAFLPWPADPVSVPAAPADSAVVVRLPDRRTLPDGSTVELKPGAEISVEYSAAVRRVILRRGVAHFQVAKNPARPFIVSANGVDVRAVGTAFSVELGAQNVEVVVTEGIVALHGGDGETTAIGPEDSVPVAPRAERQVVAGQHALVSLAAAVVPTVQTIAPGEMSQRLAWRVPRLEFSGTPLAEVITLFRRHGGVRLAVAEPSLGRVRVSGILRADNTEALFQLLAADHGIVTAQRGDETVLMHGR